MHSKAKCISKLFLGFHLWDPTFNNCSPPLHTSPGSPRAASPHIRVTSHHTSRLSRVSTCRPSSHRSHFTSHFTPLRVSTCHLSSHRSHFTSHLSRRLTSPRVTYLPSSRLSPRHVCPYITFLRPSRPTSRRRHQRDQQVGHPPGPLEGAGAAAKSGTPGPRHAEGRRLQLRHHPL